MFELLPYSGRQCIVEELRCSVLQRLNFVDLCDAVNLDAGHDVLDQGDSAMLVIDIAGVKQVEHGFVSGLKVILQLHLPGRPSCRLKMSAVPLFSTDIQIVCTYTYLS